MSKEQKPFQHEGHSRPVTRREFLAQGYIAFGGMLALPSAIGLMSRQAYAADCGSTTAPVLGLPFLAFDMAGGAALPGNFLVGKKGGPKDYLSSYDRLGWDPKEKDGLNEDFGLPMSTKYSQILAGILATASPEARARLRMGSFCHFAQDDSTTNRLNAATLVLKASQPGQYIGNGLGNSNTVSGGNSMSALADNSLKPTFVSDIADVVGATRFGGESFKELSPKQLKSLVDSAVKLGKHQGGMIKGEIGGDLLEPLANCSYEKSIQFVDGVAGLDPRVDPAAAAAFALNAQSVGNTAPVISASIAMNALKGFSGPGVWTIGGCDYHDGTSTTGDGKDRQMGETMGRSIELAHRLQRPLFFQLFTDGGCDAQVGTRKWRGDSGDKCMTVIGFYHPKGAPKLKQVQVGSFTDGQGADRTTLLGSNPLLAAYAVFANYLNCIGQLGKFHDHVPGVFTGAGELDSVIIFEGAPS